MMVQYSTNTAEAIETVYTFSEWGRIHNKRQARRKAERIYYIKQKFDNGCYWNNCTFSLIALPLGMFLMFTKEKVMMF